MNWKKKTKGIKRFSARLGLHVCSLIIRLMPRTLLYGFARNVAGLGYLIAGKHRKIALEGLRTAFGKEKTPQEIKHIARECFIFMAKSGIELIYLMNRPDLIRQEVDFVGKNNLDSALQKGRGVILVSAHFGNFPLMMCKLSVEGYPISGIMRFMRDEKAEKIFSEKRAKLGIKTIGVLTGFSSKADMENASVSTIKDLTELVKILE